MTALALPHADPDQFCGECEDHDECRDNGRCFVFEITFIEEPHAPAAKAGCFNSDGG